MKILVIQTAFLGDIVLASSFLRSLRRDNPDAEIHFLTTPVGNSILKGNPWNIEFILFDKHNGDKNLWKQVSLIKKLREHRYDSLYCLHRSFRSALFSFLSGAQDRRGFQESAFAWAFHKTYSRSQKTFEAEKNHLLLEREPKDESELFPELFLSDKDKASAHSLLSGLSNFIVLSPCSVWNTKRWPVAKFARLGISLWEKYQRAFVIVGSDSDSDQQVCAQLSKEFDRYNQEASQKLEYRNLCAQTDLKDLKAILADALYLIANDSAPMHIANALQTPLTSIFGPTTKELGFFPLAPKGRAQVSEISLDCRPCGLHGHHQCPKQHFRCMNDMNVDQVLATINL